jgi:hypothetical protein
MHAGYFHEGYRHGPGVVLFADDMILSVCVSYICFWCWFSCFLLNVCNVFLVLRVSFVLFVPVDHQANWFHDVLDSGEVNEPVHAATSPHEASSLLSPTFHYIVRASGTRRSHSPFPPLHVVQIPGQGVSHHLSAKLLSAFLQDMCQLSPDELCAMLERFEHYLTKSDAALTHSTTTSSAMTVSPSKYAALMPLSPLSPSPVSKTPTAYLQRTESIVPLSIRPIEQLGGADQFPSSDHAEQRQMAQIQQLQLDNQELQTTLTSFRRQWEEQVESLNAQLIAKHRECTLLNDQIAAMVVCV